MHNIGLSTSFKSFPKKFLAIGQKRCSKDAQKSQKLLFVTKVAQKKLLINFFLNLNQKCSLRSPEIAAFVQVLSCSCFCGYPIRIWITFFTWDTLISRVWVTDLAAWLPRGRNWLHFHRKLINCLLIHCEIWKQRQFKHYKLLRYLRIDRTLEIARIWKKLPCNLWKALTLIMANFLDFTPCKM